MKKKIKYVIFIVLVVIGIILYMHYKPDHKGLNYAKKYPYNEIMKYKIEEMGDYEKLEFRVRDYYFLFFRSIGTMYIAQYNDSNYQKQKQVIENRTYLEEPIAGCGDPAYIIPETQIEKNNWIFKIEDNLEKNDFPHKIYMIGYNDEKKSIAYMSFYDFDQDYIESLDEFIDEYFNHSF